MPKKPEDVLAELTAATQEARDTMRELHEARKHYMEVVQREERNIKDAIQHEVQQWVNEIASKARKDMNDGVSEAVDEIAASIKEKMGLTRS